MIYTLDECDLPQTPNMPEGWEPFVAEFERRVLELQTMIDAHGHRPAIEALRRLGILRAAPGFSGPPEGDES